MVLLKLIIIGGNFFLLHVLFIYLRFEYFYFIKVRNFLKSEILRKFLLDYYLRRTLFGRIVKFLGY